MRKIVALFFILCLLCSFTGFAKNDPYIDSLQTLFNTLQKDDTLKIHVLMDIASVYQSTDRQKAFDNAKAALAIAEKLNEKKLMGRCQNFLGDLFWYRGDYINASDRYFKALKIFEELNDPGGISDCYRNIGWIYQGQMNYDLTVKYYMKALAISLKYNFKQKLISNYDDLGIVHKMMGDYTKALEYCRKGIEISEQEHMPRGVASGYGNMGAIYQEMGKYEMAIECYMKSNKIHIEIDDFYNTSEDYNGLAVACLALKRYQEAVNWSKKSLEVSEKYGFRNVTASSYAQMAKAYSKLNDYANAFAALETYTSLRDSTYNERNSQQINEMSAKYESEKKELLISSLEKDNIISNDKLEKEKNFKIYLIIFCLLIAGSAFMLFRGNLQKKKANEALSHAYKEIEVKNKDITDSITYSKRIQEATLPPKDLLHVLFPDSFVLFKPKDIVSGDFYWYAEKNGKKLIAACDCTGHGVPGALMSMIGNNILNQIVNEKEITSADEILNHLHLEIRKALKQNEQPESRDGMDIALLVFNTDNQVEFAGAQRPLWIIRNNDVEEIRGNKYSIGGLQTEENRTFTKTVIPLKMGESLYIFSDGFVDQFGGQHGKKFMTKNFKDLLLNIHRDPMAQQEKTISQTFDKWQGMREQVDDVLVIGIKI